MTDSRYQALQEVSSCAEALLQASEDAEYASARQMKIRQEIGNTRNLMHNLKGIEKQAGENYELKRQIANECYERFNAAKAKLNSIEESA